MNEGTVASFIDKWRSRWPEWRIAEVFVPAGQRSVAEAWFTLLQELYESAWGGSDPTPGLAKLAWWHEELEGWAKGARRHPLGELLQRQPAPWSALGRSLNALPATRGQPAAEAAGALAGLATAACTCEAELFPGQRQAPGSPADPDALYFTDEYTTEPRTLRLIPYFMWGNRGLNQMRVWFPAK